MSKEEQEMTTVENAKPQKGNLHKLEPGTTRLQVVKLKNVLFRISHSSIVSSEDEK